MRPKVWGVGMLSKLVQMAVLVAGGLALRGCPFQGNRTAAPVKKPAAPDYQQAAAPTTGNVNRASFLNKYTAELTANAQSLRQVAARKRFNVDVVVTEMSNRMAQRAPVDREFRTRSLRALEWALDPKATSLTLVPPPYDMGPEMNIIPCPQ